MPHKHTAVDLGINTAFIPASTQSARGFQANAPHALDHQEMCSDYSFQVPRVLALPRARAELQSKDRKGKYVTRKTLRASFCLHSRGKCLSAHSPQRQQPTFQLKNACKVQRGDWFFVDLTVALTDVQALHFPPFKADARCLRAARQLLSVITDSPRSCKDAEADPFDAEMLDGEVT